MNSISLTNPRDYSLHQRSFCSQDRHELPFRQSQDSIQNFSSSEKRRDLECERDDYGSDVPIIEKLSISLSSTEQENWLVADSRDPEDNDDRLFRESRSSGDGERTGSLPTIANVFSVSRRNSAEEESGAHEFFLSNSLKRANPIYESDSEAEYHAEINREYTKRRRSHVGGKRVPPTPLYWTERFSTE